MAEEQFAGRGQINSTWISEPGKNLTFSIFLKPVFLSPDKQFDLNKAMSLALNDFLSHYFNDCATIKWPNDNYINNEKIAGLLIENVIQGGKIKYAVIGVGVNINQVFFPESAKDATSFSKMLHKDYDLKQLLNEICAAVETRYLQLKSGKLDKLNSDYITRLYGYNKTCRFSVDGDIREGTICGISNEGYLQVEIDGGMRQFGLKEIRFIIE